MPISRTSCATFLALVLSASAARAECAYKPYEFFPDRNDRVRIEVETENASFCDMSFKPGPGYRFTKVSVVQVPPHGIIATLGENHFTYHAMPEFSGQDHYVIRACAVVGGRKGCSTLLYQVSVR